MKPVTELIIIGAGPAGAAAGIVAARGGAKVTLFDKAKYGRDKVCGDGLTPRAITALEKLNIDYSDAHHIVGLRMIAGSTHRELDWPHTSRFANHGAVWPRRSLDKHLIDAANEAGVTIHWETEVTPIFSDSDDEQVIGVEVQTSNGAGLAQGTKLLGDMVVVATGAQGQVAKMLGAVRDPDEPFGLAIRSYAESPRHSDSHLEACLTLKDSAGTAVPGYGWIFPAGDGTVNIGVGALSTMKNFKKLNLNNLLADYRSLTADTWNLGPNLDRPRAWRLPMSTQKRYGKGWVAVGDAAGLINPMNGEGIDYGLESGSLASELFIENPGTAPELYDRKVGEMFDQFLRTGRRFSFLIGHPWLLRTGLRIAVGSDAVAKITLGVMGNLVDSETPGAAGFVFSAADKALALADPILRKSRAS